MRCLAGDSGGADEARVARSRSRASCARAATAIDADVGRRRLVSRMGRGVDPKAPALHFAHANGFNALTYRLLLGQLCGGFRIYATDLRGHGHTTLAANPKGMRSVADLSRRHLALDRGARRAAEAARRTFAGRDGEPDGGDRQAAHGVGLVLAEPVIMPARYLRWLAIGCACLGLHRRTCSHVSRKRSVGVRSGRRGKRCSRPIAGAAPSPLGPTRSCATISTAARSTIIDGQAGAPRLHAGLGGRQLSRRRAEYLEASSASCAVR